jgi:hypothetical protein
MKSWSCGKGVEIVVEKSGLAVVPKEKSPSSERGPRQGLWGLSDRLVAGCWDEEGEF